MTDIAFYYECTTATLGLFQCASLLGLTHLPIDKVDGPISKQGDLEGEWSSSNVVMIVYHVPLDCEPITCRKREGGLTGHRFIKTFP